MDVEPRHYRLRLLNGCDSRYLVIQLFAVDLGEKDLPEDSSPIDFTVIGGDQGFAEKPTTLTTLVFPPSARYDIIVDFTRFNDKRIIMKNIGGDEPFGGDIPGPQLFEYTDRIMAFDVRVPLDTSISDDYADYEDDTSAVISKESPVVDRVRRLGLFEGRDEFNRLMPLLGTVDLATDMDGNPIYWPDTASFREAGLIGQMYGTADWSHPTTENIRLLDTEEWELWNLSADAHPIHLHGFHFSVVSRRMIVFDSASEDGVIEDDDPRAGDGTYITSMPLVRSIGSGGVGYFVVNPTYGEMVDVEATLPEYVTNYPADVVIALPGQITTIRATFDKPGRYNWHCHILSHEDHEMMRLFHVGPLPEDEISFSG